MEEMEDPLGDPYADIRKELDDPYADRRRELKDHDVDMQKFFTPHNHQTMNISTHKNNLKICKKTIRDGSLQINSKQQILNKKDLMINGSHY